MNKGFVFLAFLLTLSMYSCMEMELNDPSPEDKFIDIGSYELLDESLEKLPYLDLEGLVFVDSSGNSITFSIDEKPLFQSTGNTLYKYDVFEVGDTVLYRYTSEIKSFEIQNDSLDMRFSVSLAARPYYPEPENEFIADVLNIYCNNPDPNITSSQVFYHETSTRTWPTSWNSDVIEEIEIMGRSFTEVYNIDFINPISVVHFNYEFGIISFTDMNGKLWRFESFN